MIFLAGGHKRVIGDRFLQLTVGIVALIGSEKVQAFWYGVVRHDSGGKKRFLQAAKHARSTRRWRIPSCLCQCLLTYNV
jgi:UTP-glucose-1-phosphate uridylyltransferase